MAMSGTLLVIAAKTVGPDGDQILPFWCNIRCCRTGDRLGKNGGFYFNGGASRLSVESTLEEMFRLVSSDGKPDQLMQTVNLFSTGRRRLVLRFPEQAHHLFQRPVEICC
jgi:hypothetical protein